MLYLATFMLALSGYFTFRVVSLGDQDSQYLVLSLVLAAIGTGIVYLLSASAMAILV